MSIGLNKISRASYSTGVTQEFLQNILARAQEATAKKSASAGKEVTRKNWKKTRQPGQIPGRRSLKRTDGMQLQSGDTTVSSRINPTLNHSIVNKQPQFKKRTTGGLKEAAIDDNILDAFDNTKSPVKSRGAKKSAASINKKNARNRGVPGLIKRNDSNRNLASPPLKSRVVQENYIPQEPTPLSLLKYHPNLAITAPSRIVGYSLDIMRAANFPLFRLPNYGFMPSVVETPKNLVYNLKTLNFGKYTPASSLIFEKERLFKNLVMVEDESNYKALVLGQYQELKSFNKDDFKGLTKLEKKRLELKYNADIARRALQNQILDPELKENAYQVCAGLKSISEL